MESFREKVESLKGLVSPLGEIYYYDDIASTHEQSLQLARAGVAEATLIVADAQSQGRGRLQRSWSSPAGRGLYFSLILHPKLSVRMAPLLSLATGLAIARVLRAQGVSDLMVKWPNDLWVGTKKLGGILSEMAYLDGKLSFVSVGVGINVLTQAEDFPPELREIATSLQQIQDRDWDRFELLRKILPEIIYETALLSKEGSGPLIQRWEQESAMIGRQVSIVENAEEQSGKVIGLSPDGKLKIQNSAGNIFEIVAGDLRFI